MNSEGAIHPSAIIGESVEFGADVSVGPFTVIGDGVRIGAGARIGSQVVIGAGCRIGRGSVIEPHATLYGRVVLGDECVVQTGSCVGSDGFGYTFADGHHEKIAQVGTVIGGAALHIGPNSTVDRGSIGDTLLADGVRLAELVHVGHNSRLGRGVSIGPHSGIAGSAILGDEVSVGGQVAIVGHIRVGDRVAVARWGGVTQDIDPDSLVAGTPARPAAEAHRLEQLLAALPGILRRLMALERRADTASGATEETNG